jgi:hypothetical protein
VINTLFAAARFNYPGHPPHTYSQTNIYYEVIGESFDESFDEPHFKTIPGTPQHQRGLDALTNMETRKQYTSP